MASGIWHFVLATPLTFRYLYDERQQADVPTNPGNCAVFCGLPAHCLRGAPRTGGERGYSRGGSDSDGGREAIRLGCLSGTGCDPHRQSCCLFYWPRTSVVAAYALINGVPSVAGRVLFPCSTGRRLQGCEPSRLVSTCYRDTPGHRLQRDRQSPWAGVGRSASSMRIWR